MRIYMRLYGMMQVPKTEGKRRSRWLVTRNSYPDLEESTIKTWLDWFPERLYGRFMWTPPYTHMMRFGDVEAEVVFEAFKGEEDIPSLKSREYTGIWATRRSSTAGSSWWRCTSAPAGIPVPAARSGCRWT
jgi:hypothetical protein